MRRLFLGLMTGLCVCMLCGCSHARQIENQAYILTMGLDRSESVGLELTVQIPRIAASGSQESSAASGGSENYFQFSAKGVDFEDALEKLEWVIPRRLNLSHLKLIVFSRELASEEGCRELIYDIVHTERLFSAARAVVCEGRAADFIAQTQAVIGSRLSSDITASFEHYTEEGFVPDSNLAELYYATESVYSDPVAVYGFSTEEESAPASVLGGAPAAVAADTQSEIKTHYLGAALFSEGVCKGVLNTEDTIYTNLLSGSLGQFRYAHDGQGLEISPDGKPKVQIDLGGGNVVIHIKIPLSISAQEQVPDLEGLKHELEAGIQATIRRIQSIGVEPFGFAETAARQFTTLKDWVSFDWRSRFSTAQITLDISLKRTGA